MRLVVLEAVPRDRFCGEFCTCGWIVEFDGRTSERLADTKYKCHKADPELCSVLPGYRLGETVLETSFIELRHEAREAGGRDTRYVVQVFILLLHKTICSENH